MKRRPASEPSDVDTSLQVPFVTKPGSPPAALANAVPSVHY
ncbi:MAG TPA: hypothetical protein VFO82_01455 [Steroidobacteraceae bacterium]|nr:hypothetical protein [Steroidobacteraceae bacterium]